MSIVLLIFDRTVDLLSVYVDVVKLKRIDVRRKIATFSPSV